MKTQQKFVSVLSVVFAIMISGQCVLATEISGGNLLASVTTPTPLFVSNPIADRTINPGDTGIEIDLSNVFAEVPSTDVIMDYVAVEIDPDTGQPAPGTGLFAYTFTLYGNADLDHVFATGTLVFTGPIQQARAFGAVPVNDEISADVFEGTVGSGYLKSLDTWLFGGWQLIAPGNSNLGEFTGDPVVLSAGGLPGNLVREQNLVHIVAEGDVQWDGVLSWNGKDYDSSGVARAERLALSVTGNTDPELVDVFIEHSYLRFSPEPGATGSADITIRATDAYGAWVEDTFTVTVVPEPATMAMLALGGLAVLHRRKR